MSGQLEYSKHSHESDHSEDGQGHGLVCLLVGHDRRLRRYDLLLLGHDGGEGDEVRDDGNEVDHVHNVFTELHLAWTRQKPH